MVNGACYVRVSTENQLENYSIEEQTGRLKAFCLAKDINIMKIYTDGGYSGGNINRPALKQMLTDIRQGGIDVVVVYKLDRLSRSQKDTLMLIEDELLLHNTDFISINENFDTSTPFGRAMIGILSVFAQLEKDQITERFTMGRIGRAKSGCFHGGPSAPTGYDYADGQLIVNEYEALQIKDLFERFSTGYSLHNCWQYMSSNYITKYGAWTSETLVRNVLRNNIYIGKIKFKGNVYEGRHEPIISEELFNCVQNIFASSKRASGTSDASRHLPFKAGNLLTGFIYCGKCGARYHGEHGNYSCYSRTKGHKKYIKDPECRNKKWKIEDLNSLTAEYMLRLDFGESIRVEKDSRNSKRENRDYSKRLKEIDRQIIKLIDLYQIDSIPKETVSAKITLLTKEKEYLLTQPSEADMETKTLIKYEDIFAALLDNGDLQEKRTCLSQLIDRIIIDGENVNIIIK